MTEQEKKEKFIRLKEKAQKYPSDSKIQKLIAKLEKKLDDEDLAELEKLIKAKERKTGHGIK